MKAVYAIPTDTSEGEFRDRGSKFVAHLAPVADEAAALAVVEEQQRTHSKCNHHCYAYRIGGGPDRYRANDDGEPSGTAGRPILGQIDSAELRDVVVVVSRYYGGTKLGTSGLINAYREAARLAIEAAPRGARVLTDTVELRFGYDRMGDVLSALSQLELEMAEQRFETDCYVRLEIPLPETKTTVRRLKATIAGVYLEEVGGDFGVEGVEILIFDS